MTEREEVLIDAAIAVFLKYGVQRSSMSDIAKEANVARQTLYNCFASKNDVLKATIRLFSERSHQRIAHALSDELGLDAKLNVVFEHSVVAPFVRLHESPNAADFIEGVNQVAKDEIQSQEEKTRALIESILRPYRAELVSSGTNPKQLSDFIQRSSSAAKHTANNRRHLNTLLRTLITMVLNTVSPADIEARSA